MTDASPLSPIRRLDGPRRPAASGQADALIVLLHGYGASGDDLFPLAGVFAQAAPSAAFAAPHAPESCRVNPMGRQWFPIPWIDGSSEAEMISGFQRAEGDLNAFLDAELAAAGLSDDRLLLIGFSQGTMISLQVGMRRPKPAAGIVGFSGRLVRPEALAAEATAKPPVLLVHGDQDDVIPVAALEEAREGLAAADIPVRWHVSRGVGHGIAEDGLELAASFIVDRLS
ncbi:MAG: dienelactone hydrolase family protein [Rhodobacteraceae bacterium]|nr:dienelactone hydrolase family protein [Paracoccaceae bacterium]